MKSRYLPYALFCLVPLVLCLPLLVFKYNTLLGNTDALYYANILNMITEHLRIGQIYPRWLPDANLGMGTPAMFYYAPLSYVMTGLLTLPIDFRPDERLVLGLYLSQIACGITAWWWLRRHFPARIALMGAALYVLLPYKLIYVYMQINLAQLWALAVLPLWMMAAEDVIRGKRVAAVYYALALSAVFYSHPLTVLGFGAVPALYTLWYGRANAVRSVALLTVAHLLALCLTAYYWMVTFEMFEYIRSGQFLSSKFDVRVNLMHIDLVMVSYYLAIAVMVYVLIRKQGAATLSATTSRCRFWMVVLGVFIVLNMPFSLWAWENIPALRYLQFPVARLHSCILFAGVWHICYFLAHWRDVPYSRFLRPWLLWTVIGISVGLNLLRINSTYSTAENFTRAYLDEVYKYKFIPPNEYQTIWSELSIKRMYNERGQFSGLLPAWFMETNSGQLKIDRWRARDIHLIAKTTRDGTNLAVRQFYLPAWHAVDGNGNDIPLRPLPQLGLITMLLPAGTHDITLTLKPAASEIWGLRLALASLLICVLIWFYERRKPA